MRSYQLPYKTNSNELFTYFLSLPYPVFFDSCHLPQKANQEAGRFDIISADPRHIMSSKHGRCQLNNRPHPDHDIFNLTKTQLQQCFNSSTTTSAMPFHYGAIGYFGYDLSHHYHALTPSQNYDIELPDAFIGIYDWSIVVDHKTQTTVLNISPDYPERLSQIINLLSLSRTSQLTPFKLTKPFTPNMNRSQYQNAFNQIKHHIRHGNCYQINLCQRFSSSYKGSPWHAYQQLRKISPAPYAAYLQLNHKNALLSLSPEQFIQVVNKHVQNQTN